ncbi:hypothetical protein LIA77_04243 [Sarocladium implicatum]|nr:hypothetical protein LIA77_04243 [Sarocladium implicatum]
MIRIRTSPLAGPRRSCPLTRRAPWTRAWLVETRDRAKPHSFLQRRRQAAGQSNGQCTTLYSLASMTAKRSMRVKDSAGQAGGRRCTVWRRLNRIVVAFSNDAVDAKGREEAEQALNDTGLR